MLPPVFAYILFIRTTVAKIHRLQPFYEEKVRSWSYSERIFLISFISEEYSYNSYSVHRPFINSFIDYQSFLNSFYNPFILRRSRSLFCSRFSSFLDYLLLSALIRSFYLFSALLYFLSWILLSLLSSRAHASTVIICKFLGYIRTNRLLVSFITVIIKCLLICYFGDILYHRGQSKLPGRLIFGNL